VTWEDATGLVAVVHAPVGVPVVVRTDEGLLVRGYRPPEGYRLGEQEVVWWGRPVEVVEEQAAPVRTVFGEKL
jgi:hypothetical protein